MTPEQVMKNIAAFAGRQDVQRTALGAGIGGLIGVGSAAVTEDDPRSYKGTMLRRGILGGLLGGGAGYALSQPKVKAALRRGDKLAIEPLPAAQVSTKGDTRLSLKPKLTGGLNYGNSGLMLTGAGAMYGAGAANYDRAMGIKVTGTRNIAAQKKFFTALENDADLAGEVRRSLKNEMQARYAKATTARARLERGVRQELVAKLRRTKGLSQTEAQRRVRAKGQWVEDTVNARVNAKVKAYAGEALRAEIGRRIRKVFNTKAVEDTASLRNRVKPVRAADTLVGRAAQEITGTGAPEPLSIKQRWTGKGEGGQRLGVQERLTGVAASPENVARARRTITRHAANAAGKPTGRAKGRVVRKPALTRRAFNTRRAGVGLAGALLTLLGARHAMRARAGINDSYRRLNAESGY